MNLNLPASAFKLYQKRYYLITFLNMENAETEENDKTNKQVKKRKTQQKTKIQLHYLTVICKLVLSSHKPLKFWQNAGYKGLTTLSSVCTQRILCIIVNRHILLLDITPYPMLEEKLQRG